MSKNNGFAISIGGTTMNLDIGKEDLLAVALANYEQGLLAEQKELTAAIRAVSKERDEVDKAIHNSRQALAEAVDRKKAEALVRAAKRVGLALTIDDTYTAVQSGEFTAIRDFLQKKSGPSYYGSPALHTIRTVCKDTPEIQDLLNRFQALEERLDEKAEALRDVTMRLRNMSTKEREARAHLVVKGLQSTEEGRNLLAALATDGNPFLLPEGQE